MKSPAGLTVWVDLAGLSDRRVVLEGLALRCLLRLVARQISPEGPSLCVARSADGRVEYFSYSSVFDALPKDIATAIELAWIGMALRVLELARQAEEAAGMCLAAQRSKQAPNYIIGL